MPLVTAVRGTWPLLLGIALMMLGNGLQGSLLGLRATLEGFSVGTTGLVMTGYFAGFFVGSTVVPKLVRNVGHIRVFAALASMASAAVLLHAVFIDPVAWGAFRLLTGFCYAGLYVVSESWLNDAATNQTRGQLLSVYMMIILVGMGTGQLLLNVADPGGFALFIIVSVLVSAALVPISLSASRTPRLEAPRHVGVRELYAVSPLGVIGAVGCGMAHAALFGMGAVYAARQGLSVGEISAFMAAPLVGGILLQWPIGRLSDTLDRRRVITAVSLVAAAAAGAAALISTGSNSVALAVLFALFGGTSLPLYSLVLAHANDHLEPEQIVAASGTLVLVGGFGSVLGPSLAGAAMSSLGPAGFFALLCAVHAGIGLFALYRMTRREPVPLAEQREYSPVSPRASPIGTAIAMDTVRDQRDRDLARWSGR